MNVRDSDFDALLAEWLEDDAFVSPSAPVEVAVDFARAHPRRRDRLAFLRRDAMTARATTGLRPVAIAVAVAALLVFAIGGAVLIGSGPDPSPTPIPSATAIPTATPVAAVPCRPVEPCAGSVHRGVPGGPVTVSLTIGDDGWTSGGWYIMNPPAFSRSVSFWTIGNVYEDLCDPASLPATADRADRGRSGRGARCAGQFENVASRRCRGGRVLPEAPHHELAANAPLQWRSLADVGRSKRRDRAIP